MPDPSTGSGQVGSPWPRVSIVTPSYNQAQFIEETIRSVLLQGYPDLEYLIIDGGSTDGSVEIIRKYEPWLAYWVSEKDRGQSEAINKGFARCTGDIVTWLNSDDYYESGAIAHAACQLATHSDWHLIYSDCNLINEYGQQIGPSFCQDYSWSLLLESNFITQPTVFFKRAVTEAVGNLNPSLHYCMDLDLWLRFAAHGHKLVRVSGAWANYRLATGTKTVAEPEAFWEENVPIVERYLAADRSLGPQQKQLIRRRLHYKAGLVNLYNFDKNGERAQKYLASAFEGGTPPYADLFRLAEEIVGYSRGTAGIASEEQRQAFIQRFFESVPSSPAVQELRGRVSMVRAFAAQQAGDNARVRHHALQAMRFSRAARKNAGLWKVMLRTWFQAKQPERHDDGLRHNLELS